jgi:hypothetical protein
MKKYMFFTSLAVFMLASCGKKSALTVKKDNFATGKAAEIILIADKNDWSENQIDTILTTLTQAQKGLNQVEPLFDVISFQNDDFSPMFQKHRNILRFEINPDNSSNYMEINYNTWTSPQVYIVLRGNSADSLYKIYLQNQRQIIQELYENDLRRLQANTARNADVAIEKLLRKKFDITVKIPNTYKINREEDDFVWLLYRTQKNDRMIMIYKTDKQDFTPDFLMNTRDSMTRKYVPGAIRGAYPVIARKLGLPIINPKTVNYLQGYEMRGLWESVNDQMGGPFYSFTFLNAHQECITVDGFVYAPQEEKRELLREVEAIVKSVE